MIGGIVIGRIQSDGSPKTRWDKPDAQYPTTETTHAPINNWTELGAVAQLPSCERHLLKTVAEIDLASQEKLVSALDDEVGEQRAAFAHPPIVIQGTTIDYRRFQNRTLNFLESTPARLDLYRRQYLRPFQNTPTRIPAIKT
jgi:hypothetical protein